MPTKPPVAMVSPSRIIRTASSADTIFPFLALFGGSGDNMGWDEANGLSSFCMATLLKRIDVIGPAKTSGLIPIGTGMVGDQIPKN